MRTASDLRTVINAGFVFAPGCSIVAPGTSVCMLGIKTGFRSCGTNDIFTPGGFSTTPFSTCIISATGARNTPRFHVRVRNRTRRVICSLSIAAVKNIMCMALPRTHGVVICSVMNHRVSIVRNGRNIGRVARLPRNICVVRGAGICIGHWCSEAE